MTNKIELVDRVQDIRQLLEDLIAPILTLKDIEITETLLDDVDHAVSMLQAEVLKR